MNTILAALFLALALAMRDILGGASGVSLSHLRRPTRRYVMRKGKLRLQDSYMARGPSMLVKFERWLAKQAFILRREMKYDLIGASARLLALYCWVTRQDGFEGLRVSYWRWLATIHLAFKERDQRRMAVLLGGRIYYGSGGPQIFSQGVWRPTPAGAAGITRVGQVSPLYYKKVAGGLPILQDLSIFPGNISFVDSDNTGAGADSAGYGTTPDAPLLTLDFAVGLCTATQADFIFALPGHEEDHGSASYIDVDVAGVSIVGVGRGPSRPRVDYNHASSGIDIGASGCMLKNLQHRPSVTVVTIGIDVETTITDTLLEDMEAIPGEAGDGTDEFVDFIQTKATCTRTHIKGLIYSHHASADGPASAVHLNGISDRVHIENFWIEISGTAAEAGIKLTGISTRVLIEYGTITTDAEPGIECDDAATGSIKWVDIFGDLATIDAITVATGMAHFEVRYVEVGNEAGTLVKTESVDD